jgi:serine/threonine protein kinase
LLVRWAGVDIWALGCVLYAMIFGAIPFKGEGFKDRIKSMPSEAD